MVTRVNWNRNYYYTYYFTPTIRIAGDWTFQIYDRLNDSSPIYTGVVPGYSGSSRDVKNAAESYIRGLPGGLKGDPQNESESGATDNETDTGIINFGTTGYSYKVTSVLLAMNSRRYTWKVYNPAGSVVASGEEIGPGYYAQPIAIQKAQDWIARKERQSIPTRPTLTPDIQDALGGTYETVYEDTDEDGIPDEFDKTDDREPFDFGGEYQLIGALGLFFVVTNMLMSD